MSKKDLTDTPLEPIRIEKEDFYIENGLYVFTEAFHLKRGYCCGSDCRHCPYEYENVDEAKGRKG
ncbi:MAG: DUF5522 domain-containing protein [Bdellovibrionales bacterium]